MRIRWRGLELPTRIERDEGTSTPTYGRFMVEPFERGFGTTVGNSLRRILLSSLEGAAVTDVKIKGADHEFMTLPGVVEDVTEIILNIKSLVVAMDSDIPKTMRVAVRGKAGETVEVRAKQIEADAAITIMSEDQLLATLTDEIDFEIEMTVGRGRGYVTAEENKLEGEDQIIGVIPVDSVHSPVTRVRYRVEDTRVGQRVNYDRLIMEIWTNGSVSPEMALVEAAKILRKHLNAFIQYVEMGSGLAAEGDEVDAEIRSDEDGDAEQSYAAMPISDLDLSVRATNCLTSAEITTVGKLIKWDEPSLLKLRAFGKTSLREVKRKLDDLGLSLASSEDEATEDAGAGLQSDQSDPSGFAGGYPGQYGGTTPVDSGSYGSLPPAVPPFPVSTPEVAPREDVKPPDSAAPFSDENSQPEHQAENEVQVQREDLS